MSYLRKMFSCPWCTSGKWKHA